MDTGFNLARSMIDRLLSDIHVQVADNFDADRFPEGAAAMAPSLAHLSKATFGNLLHASDRLAQVHDLLADAGSQALFLDLLAYRLAGPQHVKLPMNTQAHWDIRAQARNSARAPSDAAIRNQFGNFSRCEVPFLGRQVCLDCPPLTVAWSFLIKQYFFERDGIRIAPAPGDMAIDGGACVGDSTLALAAAVGDAGLVHAFDPCAGHLQLIAHNLALNPWARAALHPFGLSDHDADAAPLPVLGLAPGASVRAAMALEVPLPVPLRRIDRMVDEGIIERIDFIKLDIEGSEMAALAGAEQAIRRFRPKLAISIYHRPEDLFEIPLFLDNLGLGYKFYLDHYTIYHEETILYAI